MGRRSRRQASADDDIPKGASVAESAMKGHRKESHAREQRGVSEDDLVGSTEPNAPAGAIDFEASAAEPRLDAFLVARLPHTRSRIQRAIRDGGVLVNGVVVQKLSAKIRLGDRISWLRDAVREAPGFVEPEDIPFHIYHEDDDCIVLEKPTGMSVHPAKGLRSGTLVNALLHHTGCSLPYASMDDNGNEEDDHEDDDDEIGASGAVQSPSLQGLSHGSSDGMIVRPGIVHRLDRGTSGVMVVAKHDAAHAALAAQFAARTSRRTYLALVCGVPSPEQGTVSGNIARDPNDRLRMAVVESGRGKTAVTHYSLQQVLDGGQAALVRFRLETGRTHQVRVHSKHMGHPLLGDGTYGGIPARYSRRGLLGEGGILSRPALHAETLGFAHPVTSKWQDFSSPVPEDMKQIVAFLGGSSTSMTELKQSGTLQGDRCGDVVECFGIVWPRAELPKMIVFDVDYTLWPYWVDTHTRPPYTLRSGKVVDGRGKEMKLFPEVPAVLLALRSVPSLRLAFASRTGEPRWMEQLAKLLKVGSGSLWQLPDYREVYPGSKLEHFRQLSKKSGLGCERMLFFDDEPGSNMEVTQLGVKFVDATGGITEAMVIQGLDTFATACKS